MHVNYESRLTTGANVVFWRVASDPRAAAADKVLTRARVVEVRDPQNGNKPVHRLNELEYVPATGELLANVWYQDRIARIDPLTGVVQGWLDFRNARRDHYGGTAAVAWQHRRHGRTGAPHPVAHERTGRRW